MSNEPKTSPDTPEQERPDPEVLPKATRRKFSATQKLAHIDAVASLEGTGEIGAYLRENGLYHGQLSTWRQAYDEGGFDALKPKTRGRKNLSQDELESRNQARKLIALEKKNADLERRLAQAEAIIEVQKNWRLWWKPSRSQRTRGRTREPSPSHPRGPRFDRL